MPARSYPDCMTWETGAGIWSRNWKFRAGNWSRICHTGNSTAPSNLVPAVPSMQWDFQGLAFHYQNNLKVFCTSKQDLWGKLEFQSPLKHQNCRDCISVLHRQNRQVQLPATWLMGSPCSWHGLGNVFSHWNTTFQAGQRGDAAAALGSQGERPLAQWPRLLGQTPLAACSRGSLCVLLYLFCAVTVGNQSCKLWELKQCVSHHCREPWRCSAGVAGQLEGSCESKLHFRCICSSQAWQPQHEHLVPFHFSNLIESLSMTWALGKCSLLQKNKSNFDYTGPYC